MKFKRLVVTAIAGFVVTIASPVHAGQRDFGSIYTDCGLGGLIASHTNWAAVITNITWDLGTTAISSELSSAENCKGGKKEKTAAFILQSYAQLEKDLAQGEGAHLNALVALSSCAANVKSELTNALRTDFAKQVSAPDYGTQTRVQQAETLYMAVQRQLEGPFAQSCNAA